MGLGNGHAFGIADGWRVAGLIHRISAPRKVQPELDKKHRYDLSNYLVTPTQIRLSPKPTCPNIIHL